MKSIWKFPLEITQHQEIQMPIGAKILCAKVQREKICLWALIDTRLEKEKETRHIILLGTGYEFIADYKLEYIETAMLSGGLAHPLNLVWHVFERLEENNVENLV